jgi:hypothetical protein
MRPSIFVLTTVLLLVAACGDDGPAPDGPDAPSVETMGRLLEDAASMPVADLQRMLESASRPVLTPGEPATLTMVLLATDLSHDDFAADVRLSDASVTPATFARALRSARIEGTPDRISLLHRTLTSDLEVNASGRTATGIVTFALAGALEGRIGFEAVRGDEGWVVQRLVLPRDGRGVVRDATGAWVYAPPGG